MPWVSYLKRLCLSQPSQSPRHQILTSGMQVCVFLGWILGGIWIVPPVAHKVCTLTFLGQGGFGVIIKHQVFLECSIHLVSFPPAWSVGASAIWISTMYFLTLLPVKSPPSYLGERNLYGLLVHWGKIEWFLLFLSSNQPPMCFLTEGKSVIHKEKQKKINYRTL